MIETANKQELEELHLECMSSTAAMGKVFFPHHFTRPFSKDHDKVFAILDNETIRLSALALPRGYGKTTTVGIAFVGRKVLYREVHYVLYISCTGAKAIRDVKNLSAELTTNEDVLKTFGDIRGEQWAEGSGQLETNTGILIEGLGAGAQIRGRKYRNYRPDLIIIDDLEDPEEVRSDDRRAYLKEWFFADLLNSIDLNTTRVVLIGTVLAQNSLLAELIEEAEHVENDIESEEKAHKYRELFTTLRLEAFNDNLESNWPEYMTNDQVRAKYIAYEIRGMLDVLWREFRNIPIAKATAAFQEGMFKHYDESPDLTTTDNVVIIDPAKTLESYSAYTAIVGVGFDAIKNKIYFRDCINKRLTPDQAYKEACDMADRINARVIAIKVTSLNMYITYPFKTYTKTRDRYYEVVEIKERADKDDRVAAMVPFYRLGVVYHNRQTHIRAPLETQLLAHPKGKYKDVADAFADFIPLFDLGERFFTRQIEDGDKIEDEYKELENDILEPLPSGFFCAM